MTIRELAESIRDVVGSASPIVHAAERAGDIRHSLASIDRIRAGLGFEARTSLRDGLRACADAV